jgi:hypothetical protein
VVTVAGGADLTVSVPACSLATATAPMTTTALAPITADSNLTLFCWSTLTTPFGPQARPPARRSVPLRVKAHSSYASYPEKGLEILRLLPVRRPETSCVKYLAGVSNATPLGAVTSSWETIDANPAVGHPSGLPRRSIRR